MEDRNLGRGNKMEIKGVDLVAIVALIVCALLVYSGHNGMIISLIATIVGWYFGRATKTEEREEQKEVEK
jgi:hypothetical protein